jgi:hypothetical protein
MRNHHAMSSEPLWSSHFCRITESYQTIIRLNIWLVWRSCWWNKHKKLYGWKRKLLWKNSKVLLQSMLLYQCRHGTGELIHNWHGDLKLIIWIGKLAQLLESTLWTAKTYQNSCWNFKPRRFPMFKHRCATDQYICLTKW